MSDVDEELLKRLLTELVDDMIDIYNAAAVDRQPYMTRQIMRDKIAQAPLSVESAEAPVAPPAPIVVPDA